jgi:hypothetical protein
MNRITNKIIHKRLPNNTIIIIKYANSLLFNDDKSHNQDLERQFSKNKSPISPKKSKNKIKK